MRTYFTPDPDARVNEYDSCTDHCADNVAQYVEEYPELSGHTLATLLTYVQDLEGRISELEDAAPELERFTPEWCAAYEEIEDARTILTTVRGIPCSQLSSGREYCEWCPRIAYDNAEEMIAYDLKELTLPGLWMILQESYGNGDRVLGWVRTDAALRWDQLTDALMRATDRNGWDDVNCSVTPERVELTVSGYSLRGSVALLALRIPEDLQEIPCFSDEYAWEDEDVSHVAEMVCALGGHAGTARAELMVLVGDFVSDCERPSRIGNAEEIVRDALTALSPVAA